MQVTLEFKNHDEAMDAMMGVTYRNILEEVVRNSLALAKSPGDNTLRDVVVMLRRVTESHGVLFQGVTDGW